MKVSVVVPVYNGGNYLRKYLESFRSQEMEDAELIASDDGSTDGSDQLLREFARLDRRIRPVFNPHRGVGSAVAAGLETASGDYIMLTDDDDLIAPGALAKLYAATEGKADVVKGSAVIENGGLYSYGPVRQRSGPLRWQDMDQGTLARHLLGPPEVWTFLFRRDLVPEIRGVGCMFEDTSTAFKAKILAEDFRYIPDRVYTWRVRRDSVSHSQGFPFDIITVYTDLERWLRVRSRSEAVWSVFWTGKLQAFSWNYSRLSGPVRDEFLRQASGELREIPRELLPPDAEQLLDVFLSA